MIVKVKGEIFRNVKDIWNFGSKDFELYLNNGLIVDVNGEEIVSIDNVVIDDLMKDSKENRKYTICDFLDQTYGY